MITPDTLQTCLSVIASLAWGAVGWFVAKEQRALTENVKDLRQDHMRLQTMFHAATAAIGMKVNIIGTRETKDGVEFAAMVTSTKRTEEDEVVSEEDYN